MRARLDHELSGVAVVRRWSCTAAGRGEIPAVQQAAAHQEAAHQEAARQEAAHQSAQHVQPQVERGTRMGKSADGDKIDAGLRDRPGLLQP